MGILSKDVLGSANFSHAAATHSVQVAPFIHALTRRTDLI